MALSNAPPLAISGFITIALGLIVVNLAYFQAKKNNYKNHKILMEVAVLLNAGFLIQYITRAAIFRDDTKFEGPTIIRNFIYLPILIIHISGALVTIYFIGKHVLEARKNQKLQQSGIPYFGAEYRNRHRSFGKKVYSLWVLTYSGGIIIFLMLYILF